MNKLLRHFFPLSLRLRFLLATAGVVLVLSLAYGMVALVGYSVSFDKTTFRLLRGESNLFYTLAKWENGKINIELPENLDMQSPTMSLIYNEAGELLWAQRNVPWLTKSIQPDWLKTNGFHEIEANVDATSTLLGEDHSAQQQLKEVREDDDDAEMTHSVAVNVYPATARMPQLTIVVVDTIPIELKRSYMVWSWFIYVLVANLLLVIPLLWVAAWWSLRPIESLAREVRELEEHHREMLNPATTRELTSLVRNLNRLLKSERERYDKYRTTLTDLTHSLKTPLAVLQSTLRSMRNEKMSVSDAEPVMLEQISRISQQIGYYLHRASMRGSSALLSRELHPIAPLLDKLTSALNKVYQRKGAIAVTLVDKNQREAFVEQEASRCLECNYVCSKCVDVCPNRANISVAVPGFQNRFQTLHLDAYCNECGNCAQFCPWQGKPYKDKITVFSLEQDFVNSTNPGFFVEGASVKVRQNDQTWQLEINDRGQFNEVPAQLDAMCRIISHIHQHQSYLLGGVEV